MVSDNSPPPGKNSGPVHQQKGLDGLNNLANPRPKPSGGSAPSPTPSQATFTGIQLQSRLHRKEESVAEKAALGALSGFRSWTPSEDFRLL